MSYFPLETPVVWTVGSGCREKKQNPHKGLSERSVLEWDHKESNIRTSPPIFILGSSKGGYCHPQLPVSTACLPKGQLQSSENACLLLSALIFYLSSFSWPFSSLFTIGKRPHVDQDAPSHWWLGYIDKTHLSKVGKPWKAEVLAQWKKSLILKWN